MSKPNFRIISYILGALLSAAILATGILIIIGVGFGRGFYSSISPYVSGMGASKISFALTGLHAFINASIYSILLYVGLIIIILTLGFVSSYIAILAQQKDTVLPKWINA